MDPERILEAVENPDPRVPGTTDRYYHRLGGTWGHKRFSTELRGHPPATPLGTYIEEHDLMRAVGFWHTPNTGVSIGYALLGNTHHTTQAGPTFPLDNLDIYHDGLANRIEQAVGNATFHFTANEISTIEWDFFGTLSTFAELVNPAVTETVGPPHVGVGNTVTITPAGGIATTLIWRNLDIALNNEIPQRPDIPAVTGFAPFDILDRNVTITGVLEAPATATANFVAWTTGRTVLTFNIVSGAVAANICSIDIDVILNNFVEFVDANGYLGYSIEGKMDPAGRMTVTWT